MHIYPILLVAIVLAADGGLRFARLDLTPATSAALAIVPVLAILALAWAGTWWCGRKLDRGYGPGWIVLGERFAHYARWLILLTHAAAVLAFGWLEAVRSLTGDLILIDELLTILPAVLGVLGTWWVYHPIERRLREALLIRRLDLGKPIHDMPSRGRYVFLQARMGLLLLLVPILTIVALAETIRLVAARFVMPEAAGWIIEGATLFAALSVFLIAPLMARFLLGVQPMPEGPVRASLLGICRAHRVKVRELLLWNTGGSMINAAVMGLIGPLRYVLITDALLEAMTNEQVKAVMAHEVGHVRRHHLPWMVLTMIALIAAAVWITQAPFLLLYAMNVRLPAGTMEWLDVPVTLTQAAMVLLAFGWISRRYERQADTFAVQHLSAAAETSKRQNVQTSKSEETDNNGEEEPDPPFHNDATPDYAGQIHPDAAAAMQSALGVIATLNAVDPHRHSWRHGSIAWRQAYLQSIVGRPLDDLAIDRTVRLLKRAAAVVLVLAIGAWILLEYGLSPQSRRSAVAEATESHGGEMKFESSVPDAASVNYHSHSATTDQRFIMTPVTLMSPHMHPSSSSPWPSVALRGEPSGGRP